MTDRGKEGAWLSGLSSLASLCETCSWTAEWKSFYRWRHNVTASGGVTEKPSTALLCEESESERRPNPSPRVRPPPSLRPHHKLTLKRPVALLWLRPVSEKGHHDPQ
ncbi:hypothetical protein JZ751_013942 [Albula glossodonta]|uniref:Uncharacterized protein n=1 Tax=Albula glossodonta TaxID=121402 RepID=A0A8T2N905_9TELE|nr:hypothetical protein JZ751_013942 [Albula glossodonta]